ncbi:MAG: cell division protein FtsA [SAR324 cluster bacterium]|nr:cell division protein FtsA [SAR324 cluster bacterium]MCZ6644911.1 cell division protein FtsA [SAR324 cluster bacterium]MCZ6842403.1 cell division protein FtsA [SAR324 cluster bacterium]
MRNRDNIIVGLDIGTTKICAMAAEVDGGRPLKVVGFGQSTSDGIRKGVVIDIEKTVRSIQQALRECELMCGVQIKEVLAGIAGHHIQGINRDGMVTVQNNRTVTDDDIRRVIEAAQAINIPNDREILHILPQDFIVDEQDGVQNPRGMMGIRLEVDVHIVTCSATSAQNIIKCCNLAGLEVSNIVLEPLASAQAVLSEDEKELGVVLVDIGGGTGDIAIYSNGSIVHTSVLALGGNHLTQDIAIGLSTPISEAETLKHEHGVASTNLVDADEMIEVPSVGGRRTRTLEKRLLASIIESRLREIYELIGTEIDRSNYRHVIASGVVITGGSSIMPGADELASEILKFPTRVGFPEDVAGLTETVYSPMYATGVGLLRYGLSNGEESYVPQFAVDASMFNRVSRRMREWVQDIF